jgi:class 3 adenylate cyclase
MQCPRCQHDNPQGARFCEECATPLARACSNCGTALSANAKFCHACAHPVAASGGAPSRSPDSYTPKHLAEKILTSKAALEGERKQVTVFFADVVGFSALAERLDPEALHEVIDGCFAALAEVVHRYEGTINQFTGDGIMALFGAPIAHEDHAVRALHAALDVQAAVENYSEVVHRQWQVPFQMRLGLNTGLVVVGRIGDDLRMDCTAQGDTVNLAARMQQMAAPGAIWVAEATHRIAGDVFAWQSLGPKGVKGKSAQVDVYELRGRRDTRSRLPIVARRSLTQFTGRQAELAQLLAAWRDAQTGHGRVVSVVGEAGLGKSRLLYEFKHRLEGDDARYVEGTCFNYGSSISYLPFLEIVRAYCSVSEDDNEIVAKRYIHRRLTALGLDVTAVAPYLQHMLSLHVDDPLFAALPANLVRQRTVEALQALVLAEARQGPGALILEDVHWIDKATEDVVGSVVDAISDVPILLVLAYRPEYLHGWADRPHHARIDLESLEHGGGAALVRAVLARAHASQVSLAPLEPAERKAMAQALFETATIPAEIDELIVSKTDGNPLFIEELTRSLLERGAMARTPDGYVVTTPVSTLDPPATLQGCCWRGSTAWPLL